MERLPYIDEHARVVASDRERCWHVLTHTHLRDPERLTGAPPGFVVDGAEKPSRLALRGRHWFSRYALIFELDELDHEHTRIRAQTWADFPGVHGRIYKFLVIDSRVHRVVVRTMLRTIAARI